MNKYPPQSTQRPQRFFWVKTKNANYSIEIGSYLPSHPPGKMRRGCTKRRRRAQRSFLGKPWT
jgi:hypothetical protein